MYKRFLTICRVFPPCRLWIGKFKLTQERVFSVYLSKSMKRAPMQPLLSIAFFLPFFDHNFALD